MNLDLSASACLLDFSSSNFTNASTLQLDGMIVSRDGVFDTDDSNITPNIDSTALASAWADNVGIGNTHEGGSLTITTEIATTISTAGVFVDLAGTYTASELQHFDEPSNGQLRHLGFTPHQYKFFGDFSIDGPANADLRLKIVKWDASASAFVDVFTQARQVNNFSGGRDVAFFSISTYIEMSTNDYVKLQVSNETNTTNLTAELSSFFDVETR